MDKSRIRTTSYMLLSATCLALGFLFIKLALNEFQFIHLVFVRFFVGFLCLIVVLLFQGKLKETVKVEKFKFHMLRAIVVLISQYCLFYFIWKSTLLNAVILMNIAPLFIPLINHLFFDLPMSKAMIIGEVISLAGVLLMYHPHETIFAWVTIIGLFSAFTWALSQALFAYNMKTTSSETGMFYLFFLVSLLSFPPLLFFPENKFEIDLKREHVHTIILFLGLGLFSFLNQFFRAMAYKLGNAAKLTTLLYFSVFVAIFLDWFFFHRIPSLLQIIGAIIVMVGGFLSIFLERRIK